MEQKPVKWPFQRRVPGETSYPRPDLSKLKPCKSFPIDEETLSADFEYRNCCRRLFPWEIEACKWYYIQGGNWRMALRRVIPVDAKDKPKFEYWYQRILKKKGLKRLLKYFTEVQVAEKAKPVDVDVQPEDIVAKTKEYWYRTVSDPDISVATFEKVTNTLMKVMGMKSNGVASELPEQPQDDDEGKLEEDLEALLRKPGEEKVPASDG